MPEVAGLKIDRTINYGHILQALTLMIGLGGTAVYTVQTNAETRLTIAAVQAEVAKHGPAIAVLEASNNLNTERLTNQANSLRSQREDFNQVSAEMRKTDAQLQAEINVNRVAIAGLNPRRGSVDN